MAKALPFAAVPFKEWPALHRQRFGEALVQGGLLDDCGALSGLPLWHQSKVRLAWGRWLGFQLFKTGETSRASTFGREMLTAYAEILQAHFAPATVWANVRNLWLAAKVVEPAADHGNLDRLKRTLARHRAPLPRPHKLLPVQELYELGGTLMKSAGEVSNSVKAAARYRDGLAIALLASRPFRIGNLGTIEIGKHLIRRQDGFTIQFAGAEVKNGKPIAMPVPDELVAPLAHYVDVLRPMLLKQRGRWINYAGQRLWISEHGSALCPKRHSERIAAITKKHLGIRIGPHFFRNIAATSIATEDPTHAGIAATILGHRSARSAERHYNLASTLDAARKWESVIGKFKIGRQA